MYYELQLYNFYMKASIYLTELMLFKNKNIVCFVFNIELIILLNANVEQWKENYNRINYYDENISDFHELIEIN